LIIKGGSDEERRIRSPRFSEKRGGRKRSCRNSLTTAPRGGPAGCARAGEPGLTRTGEHLRVPQSRRGGFRRGAGRPHGAGGQYTPRGTELGLNTYIDRALAGGWGKGDRLYMQGPWKQGVPSQGYQLPLTPAELYRTGIAAANTFCVKTYGKSFDKITESQREELLLGLRAGKVVFENGPPARVFFATLYQNVMEGLFADPIYGGNRNKAGWKMIGFPGVIAVHYQNVEKYRGKKYSVDPVSISDMS